MALDYNAPAELFLAKRTKSRENYRRFATAAEAIRYAVETLRTPKAFGAWLEAGDERFNSTEIERLYEALRKADRVVRARSPRDRWGPSSGQPEGFDPHPWISKKGLKTSHGHETQAGVVRTRGPR